MGMASRRANGVAIREIRLALGLSLTALATDAGIDKSALSRIETGVQQPRPATLRKICDRLGVSLAAITYPVADPQPEEVA